VLRSRATLTLLGSQLPGHIKSLNGPALESIKAQVDAATTVEPDAVLCALVFLMDRLAAGWQMVRLATKAAGGDTAARVAATPYGVSVTIVLTELERMVRELATDLKSGRGIAVAAMLKDVHDAVRGLRSELDLPADSIWGKQLAAIRADISKLLSAEIELVGGRMRRLLRPRPVKDITPNSTIDSEEVNEVETLIGFVVACRSYASELAVNEVTQRAFADVQHYLDTGTRPLIDALRVAGDGDRAFRRSQVEAAVRFCGKVFGREYAALLTKSAEVAEHDNSERQMAKA
jgi:HPt (histidine-containing phosphotransfer) domain-containing protein